MSGPRDETVAFYDENADAYVERTVDLSMAPEMDRFVELLPPVSGPVLDAGCGSGRDLLAFQRRGIEVEGLDASAALVRRARDRSGLTVHHRTHQAVSWTGRFRGVWAAATLLHLPRAEFEPTVRRYVRSLVPGGILFASLKVGTAAEDGPDGEGRHFTYYTLDGLAEVVDPITDLTVVDLARSRSRSGAARGWLNLYARRVG